MAFWGKIFGRPKMQDDTAHDFIAQLATHLAAQQFGDGDLPDTLQFSGSQRDRFIRFPPLFRAVSIISSLCAQMMCNGGMTVRNADDAKVVNRRTSRILELLGHSPDGGITPAENFVEDVMADYLLDGNALVEAMMMPNMVPIGLVRYRSHGAFTVQDGGPVAYRAQRALSTDGMLYTISARDMIHTRWPLLRRGYLAEHHRMYFAASPVSLFARQFVTGLIQDAYLQGRFNKAPLTGLLVNYEVGDDKTGGRPTPTPVQIKEIGETLAEMAKKSGVITGYGSRGMEVTGTPVHEHTLAARAQLVEEIARIYGLPLPLLSAPLGQWTRGVNEQVMKMAWRTGVRPHLDRFLGALKTRLLLPGERFEVDPSEFVRGDAGGISDMLTAMQGDAQRNPVASERELRHIAGLPREPDGTIKPTVQPKPDGSSEPPAKPAPAKKPVRIREDDA